MNMEIRLFHSLHLTVITATIVTENENLWSLNQYLNSLSADRYQALKWIYSSLRETVRNCQRRVINDWKNSV